MSMTHLVVVGVEFQAVHDFWVLRHGVGHLCALKVLQQETDERLCGFLQAKRHAILRWMGDEVSWTFQAVPNLSRK